MASRDTPWGLSDTDSRTAILTYFLTFITPGPEKSVSTLTRFSSNYIFTFLPLSSSSSLNGHIDLVIDLLYFGPEMSVSAMTQKVMTGFSLNYIFTVFLPISSSSLLYVGPEMSVSAITQKIMTGFSFNYIFTVFLPISSSSSLRGHIDLIFDLLYFGPEMSVSAITPKVPTGFSSNYIFRFLLPISSLSLLMGHIAFKIVKSPTHNHTKRHHLGVNQKLIEHVLLALK